ncbi:MAG: hypothetical protein LBU32_18635 [Clostridiales bacterium]|nr:hypothetical protein [Clostridiales bacterium]
MGGVESKAGRTRRNMLVPVPVIDDFDAFNKELLARCGSRPGAPPTRRHAGKPLGAREKASAGSSGIRI